VAPFVEDTAVGRSPLLKMSAMARSSIASPASTQYLILFSSFTLSTV